MSVKSQNKGKVESIKWICFVLAKDACAVLYCISCGRSREGRCCGVFFSPGGVPCTVYGCNNAQCGGRSQCWPLLAGRAASADQHSSLSLSLSLAACLSGSAEELNDRSLQAGRYAEAACGH